MKYTGKSKTLKALFDRAGGGGNPYALSREAAAVEEYSVTNSNGTVKVYRMMIGVLTVVVSCPELSGSQTTIANLPEKFRPKDDAYMMGQDDNAESRGIGIKSTGQIVAYAGNSGMYAAVSYIIPTKWDYEVASYYKDATDAAIAEINSLDDSWTSFAVVTDVHGRWNQQNSQDIVRAIVEHTDVNAFFLGDCSVVLWEDGSQFDTFAAKLIPCSNKVYFALGNHDREAWDDFELDQVKACYDAFVCTKDVEGVPESYYYYWDDTERKTRWMVINTSESQTDNVAMSSTQISWISSHVTLPGTDWNLVVLGHVDINPDETVIIQSSTNAAAIKSAISGCNGHVVGYFCGHQHIDRVEDLGAFHETMMLCDCIDTRQYYPEIYRYPVRTAGTESEQAVTVVHFNRDTGAVKFTRIGAYTSGLTEYNYKGG